MSARTRTNKRSKRAALEVARQLNEPGWSAIRAARGAVAARDCTAARFVDKDEWVRNLSPHFLGMWGQMEDLSPGEGIKSFFRMGVHHGYLLQPGLDIDQTFKRVLDRIHSQHTDLLRLAEVHVISPEMHAVVQVAADTIDESDTTTLLRDDIPIEHGLLLLPHPVGLKDGVSSAVALSWTLQHLNSELPCLVVTAWTQPQVVGSPLVPVWAAPIFLAGEAVESFDRTLVHPDHLGIAAYMFTYIRLAAQRIIIVPRLREYTGPIGRSGNHDDVRIIRLRSAQSPRFRFAEPHLVEWRHRWVVKMHKTKQWYPSLGVHRVIFRGPFFKGPEGAPLLTGEKVSALVR